MKELIKNRSFIFLWAAQGASSLGHTFSAFVIACLVYELTGSKLAMSGMHIAFMVPNLSMQLLAGPYLDRWNRRAVMIFSQWTRAAVYLAAVVLYPLGLLEVWHLYLITIVSGAVEPLFRASSMAYVAEILPKSHLMQGNSLLQGTVQVLMLAGPALGGLLVTTAGAGVVLICLVGALGLAGLLLCRVPQATQPKREQSESWFAQFREGVKFFQVYTVLFWVGMLLTVINACNGASQPMFLPFVKEELGGTEQHYGIFTSASSAGMLLGSLWTGLRKDPQNRRLAMLGSLLLGGLMLGGLGWVRSFPAAVALTAGSGFFSLMFTINNTTLYQKRVPEELRGRVFAVRMLMAQAGIPIGSMIGGLYAEAWGIRSLFTALGAVMVLVTAAALLAPVYHKLNDPAPGEASVPRGRSA